MTTGLLVAHIGQATVERAGDGRRHAGEAGLGIWMGNVELWRASLRTAQSYVRAGGAHAEDVRRGLDGVAIFARDDARGGTLAPLTELASELVDDSSGSRARGVLDGLASWMDAGEHGAFSTLAIPSGTDAAHRALEGAYVLRDGSHLAGAPVAALDSLFAPDVRRLQFATSRLSAVPGGGGSIIAGNAGADLLDLLRGVPAGSGASLRDQLVELLHETEHLRSTRAPGAAPPLRDVEEGVAQLLAHWDGNVEEFARHLGVGVVERPGRLARIRDLSWGPYVSQHKGMAAYARLAGLDPAVASDVHTARAILRPGRLEDVPASLAARIATHQGRDEAFARAAAHVIGTVPPRQGSRVVERALRAG